MDVEDPYIWMENLDDERVKKFIEAENKRLADFLGDIPSKLMGDLEKYFFVEYLSQAQLAGDSYFLLKRIKNRYLLERHWFDGGEADIILDSRELGKETILVGFKYYEPRDLLAYWRTEAGSDIMKVSNMELETSENIDELEGSIWGIVFLSESKYYYARFYRTEKTPDGVDPPAERILLREDGEETIAFGEGLQTNYFITLKESLDRSKILLNVSHGWSEGKLYGGKIDDPSSWRLLYDPKGKPIKMIDFVDGRYYFIGYGDKGTGALLSVDEDGDVEIEIPEDEYPLNSGIATEKEILLEFLVDAVSKIDSYDPKRKEITPLFDREHYSYYFHHSDGKRVLLTRTTFWVPYELLIYENGETKTLRGEKMDGEYQVDEGFATSHDGTKIHYFKVKKRGVDRKIALVYGYGGFAIPLTPGYIFELLKLLDDGFTYVLTNLRGGSEYGENWHRAGMLLNKMNVFYDYISVLRELKNKGYRTIAMGGSNGGLLVGATLNMRPDLIDVALIGYPVLDMMRFHKLYIGGAWIPEYGNPENEEHKQYMLKYSPYHNIKPEKKYPPTLVYTGLNDDRVHPAHALKYVAKMKEIGAPVYLRVETKSGHMGAAPETRLKERADIMSFIYRVLG